MKQLKKCTLLLGLGAVANNLVAAPVVIAPAPTHVQVTVEKNEPDSLKLTGSFRLRGFYDFKPYEAKSSFSPAAIPLVEDKDNKKSAEFDIPTAILGIKKNFPWGDNAKAIEFVMQTKLSTEGLKLKRIYIDHDKFRAGIAVSNLCDLAAMPATLTEAPNSAAGANTAQLAWKDQRQGGLSYGIAAEKALALDIYPEEEKEKGGSKVKNLKKLTSINDLPAVSAHVKYEKSFGYVRLGGLLRTLDYYEKSEKKTNYKPAWGANLTSTLKIFPEKTTLKLGGVYGAGVGSYLVDLASTPKQEHKDVYIKQDKELELIAAWGAYAGLEQRWLPKLRSTLVYGILDTTINKKGGRKKDAYKQGHYASANLTYHPTDNLMFGVEYLYGKRSILGDKQKNQDAHRIQAAVGFTL